MTDDNEPAPLTATTDGEMLLYDYFKHLTTLSLLALGGVLTLAEMADPADVKPWLLVAAIVLISGGGVAAFSGGGEIVRARYTRTAPHKTLQFHRIAAPALLAIGVGMFLSMFVDSLDR